MDRIIFYDQISRNKRYSWILMGVIFLGLAFLTLVFSFIFARLYGVGGMFIFLMFATVFNIGYILVTYYKSAEIALASVSAQRVDDESLERIKKASPKAYQSWRMLYNVVEEMTIAGGLPKPKVYVMPSADINAFAAGRDPEHSVICVTEGALDKLDRTELQGVIAHEMTHIRNFDIRFVTLVAVMVGLVSILSQMFLRSMWYSNMGGSRRSGRGGGGGLMIALVLAGFILSILAPLIVKLVQLAISRKREYMADAGGVELTRYPQGLASALRKIKADYAEPRAHTKVDAAVAPMFLADTSRSRFMEMFQTHPPIDDRIRILESM